MRKVRLGLGAAIILLVMQLTCVAGDEFLFDFEGHPDTHPGEAAIGYTVINPTTAIYSAAQGYGFLDLSGASEVGGRLRGGIDLRLKDFIFIEGIELVFRVDLPNGLYEVQSWSGDMDFARGSLRMIVSLDGGVTEDILYGCDSEADAPLPGTFMTTFVDSGTPGVFDQTIPNGKQHSGANYRMEAREFLQVHDQIEVVNGNLTFMVGSGDRILNAIEIRSVPTSCAEMIEAGEQLQGDINGDCHVNLLDFAEMAAVWGECDDPADPSCQ